VGYTAQQCLDRAADFDRMASRAKDPHARTGFIECARQWRELEQIPFEFTHNPRA
jgi:hypothetical protein